MRTKSLSIEIPEELPPQFPVRVMAGVRPEGAGLHMGHYFGTVQHCIALQHEYPGEVFCVIADYHALASQGGRAGGGGSVEAVARDYLALGLDPTISTLYRQSDVPQVCELMWLLSCYARKARLDRIYGRRMAQADGQQGSVGLFLYPALLAADLLALRATDVPLARDQASMLEIVRDVGRAFNQRWRTLFPLPQLREPATAALCGIDGRKMSGEYGNELPVYWTSGAALRERVMSMVTSSTALGHGIDPDSCPVFQIYARVAEREEVAEMRTGLERGRLGYRAAKQLLVDALSGYFIVYHERIRELEGEPVFVEEVLQRGAQRVREEVDGTLDLVRDRLGFDRGMTTITPTGA